MLRTASFLRVALFLLVLLMLPAGSLYAQKKKRFTVVLDAGHGGNDPGAVHGKVKEKDINLTVTKMLAEKINRKYPEVKVVFTRSTDVFVTLEGRSNKANKEKADLFISIHVNSFEDKSSNGVETFMWGIPSTEDEKRLAMYENQVVELEKDKGVKYKKFDSDEDFILKQLMFDQDVTLSAEIAQLVQKALVKSTKRTDRGVKSGDLYVLRNSAMPRILIEMPFLSNAGDRQFLTSAAGQKKIVEGIFEGFSKYYELYGKNNDDNAGSASVDAPEEVDEENVKSGVPLFKVQLFAADTKLKSNDKRFKGLKTDSFKEGKWYKYTYGSTEDYDKAVKMKKEVSAKFKDAFVIAFIDGKRVETSKAIEIYKKNKKKKK